LDSTRKEASTTSLGNLFQCLTTHCVKSFFFISDLNLLFSSFKALPLVLSLHSLIEFLQIFLQSFSPCSVKREEGESGCVVLGYLLGIKHNTSGDTNLTNK